MTEIRPLEHDASSEITQFINWIAPQIKDDRLLAVTHPSPAPMRYAALTHPTQELQVI